MKILITGGAGFVGSSLAKFFKLQNPKFKVVCLDNLNRRGGELNLPEFRKLGIEFTHGDIRNMEDLESLEDSFDVFIEASAEPSVLAGLNGSPKYLLNTNLVGTINCLEFARKKANKFIFLSTSRVYSIKPLLRIPLVTSNERFVVDNKAGSEIQGFSSEGISENFSTNSFRSLYGASKLSSELLIQEYSKTYGLNAIINRCGVICGEGQWGKTDQGVFTLWVARHYFKKELSYTGFGGLGHQVRDLIHPLDLFDLIQKQLENDIEEDNFTFNIGGGNKVSTSLLEYTRICEEVTGNKVHIRSNKETNPVDIPYYISDCSNAHNTYGWKPRVNVEEIVTRINDWISKNETTLKEFF